MIPLWVRDRAGGALLSPRGVAERLTQCPVALVSCDEIALQGLARRSNEQAKGMKITCVWSCVIQHR